MAERSEPAVLEWIDDVADRFDAAWRSDSPPQIADFLGDAAGYRRAALLAELVKIDLEYCWQAGQRRGLEDYLREFSELRGPDGSTPDDLVVFAGKVFAQANAEQELGRLSTGPLQESPTGPTRVRCPNCRNPVSVETVTENVTCPTCGNSFRLEREPPPEVLAENLPRPLGRFQLLELLGRGSFGRVYKAHDPDLGRLVAIKVPRAGYFGSRQEEERFLGEARSVARLTHPHIVPVHAIGRDGEMPFIVSDYVPGQTLAQRLADRRPTFREAAELTAVLGDALDYAHRNGVVHRDVKPGNILLQEELTTESAEEEKQIRTKPNSSSVVSVSSVVKLADFGLARREDASIAVTLDGQVLGTPAYMPPEQAAGEQSKVDGRSDVYSLGVVLYEMLTGELPFRGSLRMLLHQVIHEEPRPPRKHNDRIPRDLETICLKALAKSPARRYQTAGEMAVDLRRFLKNEPIHARPVSNAERLWRWCKRNPRVALLTAAVAASLLIGTGVSLFFATDAIVEKNRADGKAREAEDSLQRARDATSREKAAGGILMLKQRDRLGLLELLEARQSVNDLPEASDSRALLWSEWHDAASSGQLLQVVGHDAQVVAVALSPDGQVLATGGRDGTARLWDTSTGRLLRALIKHETVVERLAFSPNGTYLITYVSSEKSSTVRVWDRKVDWQLVQSIQQPGQRRDLAFSPKGDLLAVTSLLDEWRCLVRFYAVATWEPLGASIESEGITDGVFSPDGKLLATSGKEGAVNLWDTATGRRHRRLEHRALVYGFAFSPNGKFVVSAGNDHAARIWNTADGTPHGEPLRHGEDVRSVAFSPNGKLLVTACYDGTARLWDPETCEPRPSPLRHPGPIVKAAFSRDGRFVVTRSLEGTINVWDSDSHEARGWQLEHPGGVSWWDFSNDGKLLVTGSPGGTARIWNLAAIDPKPLTLEHQDRVWGVAFTPDGKQIATGAADGTVRLWDVFNSEPRSPPLRILDEHGKPSASEVLTIAISPDGRYLAAGGAAHVISVWDLRTQKLVITLPEDRKCPVRTVAFSPNGNFLASADDAGVIALWKVDTWERCGPKFDHPETHIDAMAVSPDSSLLATGSIDNQARVFSVATGKLRFPEIRHQGLVEAVAFSPDGKLLATASRDMTIRLWDTETGRPVGLPYQQQSAVQALAFSREGKLLATVSADHTARLWDLATGLQCGQPFRHGAFASSLAFSPDGKLLATGSFDKTARIWKLPARVNDLREMQLRTWVTLGARRNEDGLVEAIPWREWQEMREELRAMDAR